MTNDEMVIAMLALAAELVKAQQALSDAIPATYEMIREIRMAAELKRIGEI